MKEFLERDESDSSFHNRYYVGDAGEWGMTRAVYECHFRFVLLEGAFHMCKGKCLKRQLSLKYASSV